MCEKERIAAQDSGRDVYEVIIEAASDNLRSLYFLPHFVGAGTPYLDSHSRGALVGLTIDTTKEDISRAVLDSINYEAKLNIERMNQSGCQIGEIRAIGGGAKSARWLQMKADTFGMPVVSMKTSEAASLGAAILGGIAAGCFGSIHEAVDRMVEVKQTYEPNAARGRQYECKYREYVEIYPALRESEQPSFTGGSRMNSRERVALALNHKEPDRVPVDFGGSLGTGMHCSIVYQLRQKFGLDKPGTPVKVNEPYQMLGEIAPDLADILGIDVTCLAGSRTLFGFKNEGWKPWTTFDGTPVLVAECFNTAPEPNGDILMYPEGDKSAPPSGHMPKNGWYFDTIVRQQPIDDDTLTVEDNLEEFRAHLGRKNSSITRRETDRLYTRDRSGHPCPASPARRSATSRWCPPRGSSSPRASAISRSGT